MPTAEYPEKNHTSLAGLDQNLLFFGPPYIYVICIFLLPDCCLAPLYIYIQTSNQKQNCSKWRIFGLFIKIYCSRLWIIVDLQKEDKFS